MDQSNSPNPGKGLGMTGFILALLTLVGGFVVGGIAVVSAAATGGGMILGIVWAVLALIATILSFMGMSKSKAAGHKAGIAMAGLIIGIAAVLYAAYICYAVHLAQGLHGAFGSVIDAADSAIHHAGDSMK
ncbi:MAG: hypothetical protein HY064_14760 [Bacteroidetes bacterium]|nr:hypothetical protein [Bacteroidota bacterium]